MIFIIYVFRIAIKVFFDWLDVNIKKQIVFCLKSYLIKFQKSSNVSRSKCPQNLIIDE